MEQLRIRVAAAEDLPAIEAVHRAAFETDLEARLVRLLIERGQAAVSMVTESQGKIVGHVLFSPARCESNTESVADLDRAHGRWGPSAYFGLGLAPLAVMPEHQRRGIGAALSREGLAECRRLKAPSVVVLGEPSYYSRFGFVPASRYGLTCEFGGGDAFQILVFDEQQPPAAGSNILYASEFRELCGDED